MRDEHKPDPRPERVAMRQALKNLQAEQRKPTDDDRPPLTTFPSTRASREALRYTRLHDRPFE